jgi:hypothetical protein
MASLSFMGNFLKTSDDDNDDNDEIVFGDSSDGISETELDDEAVRSFINALMDGIDEMRERMEREGKSEEEISQAINEIVEKAE